MSNELKIRIRKVYSIILTCALIATGLSLMGGCLYIYLSGGDAPFTPESVSAVFRKISWLVWLSLALLLGSLVLLPREEKRKHRRQAMAKEKSIAPKTLQLLRWGCLLLGAAAVVLGVCFDGVQAAVANAIALCMSCIGLG